MSEQYDTMQATLSGLLSELNEAESQLANVVTLAREKGYGVVMWGSNGARRLTVISPNYSLKEVKA